jgi:hypothetical protein
MRIRIQDIEFGHMRIAPQFHRWYWREPVFHALQMPPIPFHGLSKAKQQFEYAVIAGGGPSREESWEKHLAEPPEYVECIDIEIVDTDDKLSLVLKCNPYTDASADITLSNVFYDIALRMEGPHIRRYLEKKLMRAIYED